MSSPRLSKPNFHLLALAVLSFITASTEALGRGGSGESLAAALPSDAVALLSFKTNGDLDSKLLYTTNEHFDYCQWQGVKCSQGRIVRYVVQSFGLRGTVAADTISRLDQLRVLSLRNNTFFGPLPDFSQLVNLKSLFLDHNYFAGAFPLPILYLHRLLVLDLSHNNLTGLLPANLTALDRLGYLRLESNRFYGPIPALNQTTLEVFDVSNNNLSGAVPATPTLKRFKISSFLGNNPNLCGEVVNKPCKDYPFFNSSSGAAVDGGVSKSPPSPLLQNADSQLGLRGISREKQHRKVGLVLGVVTGTLIVLAGVLSIFALIRKRREDQEDREHLEASHVDHREATSTKKETALLTNQDEPANTDTTAHSYESKQEAAENRSPEQQIRVVKSGSLAFCSGEEELYNLDQLMRASAELLGRGTMGTTYKAVMANQLIVTVKRLDACKTSITSVEEFEHHMEIVGALRHPNLVPVRAYFQARQERLIVYDYQPNGSLYNLIHGSRSTRAKPLHWTSCLKIAEDIAQGLAYIHQASKLIHGNLKSSNILLGSDFEACITDYCLSILTDASSPSQNSSNNADDSDSSYNYKAPEVGKRKATVKSDVYAFGVLLLELLTGKLPSHHPFLAPPDVPDWVRAMRVDDGEDDVRLGMLVEVASICRATSPEQRPSMWQVLKMITNIKEIMDDSTKDDDVYL